MYKINDIVKHWDSENEANGYSIGRIVLVGTDCYSIEQLCYIEYCGGNFHNYSFNDRHTIHHVIEKDLTLVYRPEEVKPSEDKSWFKLPYELYTKLYHKVSEGTIEILEVSGYEFKVTDLYGTALIMRCTHIGNKGVTRIFNTIAGSIKLPENEILSTNINDLI